MNNMQRAFKQKAKMGLRGYVNGGPVSGPGGPTDDKVDIKASHGEYVLPADTVAAVGVPALDGLRDATHVPVVANQPAHFADGGAIHPDPRMLGTGLAANAGLAMKTRKQSLDDALAIAEGGQPAPQLPTVAAVPSPIQPRPRGYADGGVVHPDPRMLGTGLAANAGLAMKSRKQSLDDAIAAAESGQPAPAPTPPAPDTLPGTPPRYADGGVVSGLSAVGPRTELFQGGANPLADAYGRLVKWNADQKAQNTAEGAAKAAVENGTATPDQVALHGRNLAALDNPAVNNPLAEIPGVSLASRGATAVGDAAPGLVSRAFNGIRAGAGKVTDFLGGKLGAAPLANAAEGAAGTTAADFVGPQLASAGLRAAGGAVPTIPRLAAQGATNAYSGAGREAVAAPIQPTATAPGVVTQPAGPTVAETQLPAGIRAANGTLDSAALEASRYINPNTSAATTANISPSDTRVINTGIRARPNTPADIATDNARFASQGFAGVNKTVDANGHVSYGDNAPNAYANSTFSNGKTGAQLTTERQQVDASNLANAQQGQAEAAASTAANAVQAQREKLQAAANGAKADGTSGLTNARAALAAFENAQRDKAEIASREATARMGLQASANYRQAELNRQLKEDSLRQRNAEVEQGRAQTGQDQARTVAAQTALNSHLERMFPSADGKGPDKAKVGEATSAITEELGSRQKELEAIPKTDPRYNAAQAQAAKIKRLGVGALEPDDLATLQSQLWIRQRAKDTNGMGLAPGSSEFKDSKLSGFALDRWEGNTAVLKNGSRVPRSQLERTQPANTWFPDFSSSNPTTTTANQGLRG